jgi:hypothetical protein
MIANARKIGIRSEKVPKVYSTKENLAISTNAEMARFVRYLGGCRPGDDSHWLIWEAVSS